MSRVKYTVLGTLDYEVNWFNFLATSEEDAITQAEQVRGFAPEWAFLTKEAVQHFDGEGIYSKEEYGR